MTSSSRARAGRADPLLPGLVPAKRLRRGVYGEAETLAQAKNVAVEELRDGHGLLTAAGDAVKLRPLDKYGPERRPRLGK